MECVCGFWCVCVRVCVCVCAGEREGQQESVLWSATALALFLKCFRSLLL